MIIQNSSDRRSFLAASLGFVAAMAAAAGDARSASSLPNSLPLHLLRQCAVQLRHQV